MIAVHNLLRGRRQVHVERVLKFNHVPLSFAALAIQLTDQRHKEHRQVARRWDQKEFREAVFSTYAGKCCLTGYSESSALEAAHIMPYMGDQSNLIDNGLLLRVDVHRLFDKFLISINPQTLRVVKECP